MRHALIPWAGDALLLGAGRGVMSGNWVQLFGGERCAIEEGWHVGRFAGLNNALDPDLRSAVVLPVGKEADAVSAAEDGVQIVLKLIEGKIFVDNLPHLECGQQVEGDARDDAKRSERDNGTVKHFAILSAGERSESAVGIDKFDGRNSGAEITVMNAGTVSGSRAGTDDRNMRQRGQVMQRVAVAVEKRRKLSIANTCPNRDGTRLGINGHLVQMLKRDLVLVTLCDRI